MIYKLNIQIQISLVIGNLYSADLITGISSIKNNNNNNNNNATLYSIGKRDSLYLKLNKHVAKVSLSAIFDFSLPKLHTSRKLHIYLICKINSL